jgi:hypothetical protein
MHLHGGILFFMAYYFLKQVIHFIRLAYKIDSASVVGNSSISASTEIKITGICWLMAGL